MTKELYKGNYAIAEASIRAGLEGYFGYPITPQTEILEWLAKRLPEEGRVFLQAESEVAAINMAYGAACTGARVMVSSSSPGISLMTEGFSYIAGSEVPLVVVNVMRGGPGLGNIAPAQADYNQMVRPGGHGDYRQLVFAPFNVQESVDLTVKAFDLAQKYRMITVVLVDGAIGQLMEPAELPEIRKPEERTQSWALSGADGRAPRSINSFDLDMHTLEAMNLRRLKTWNEIEKNEILYKEYFMDDAEIALVAYGSVGRIALSAVRAVRERGIKAGLIRPITVAPFPYARIMEISRKVKSMLVVEMSSGQMLDDVLIAVGESAPVEFYGRMGGIVPFPGEVEAEIERIVKGVDCSGATSPRNRWIARMSGEAR